MSAYAFSVCAGMKRHPVAGLDLDRALQPSFAGSAASLVLLLSPLTVSALSNVAASQV